MASAATITPIREFRDELARRGGADAARCFQCATCSSVCDLATQDSMFPRRQMLWAQWGLVDRLASDPAIWLCHQCNDCTARCPRDARPGDALQALRSLMIEHLGSPGWMARLVGSARKTWPILLGVPVLFWAVLIYAVNGFEITQDPLAYSEIVPALMIQGIFVPAAAFAAIAAFVGARRSWAAWGAGGARSGGLIQGLTAVAGDILLHKRFGTCGAAKPRQMGHFLLLWGFLGALVTTTVLAFLMDILGVPTPLPLSHPVKILGNISAVLLVIGVVLLILNRMNNPKAAGTSSGYDNFFLTLVTLLVLSGVGAEVGRLLLPVPVAVALYVLHLGMILSLFLTFPFSKFAHALYRTLAMAHERVATRRSP